VSGCPGAVLSALVDGALDHEERDRVLAHLAGCPACRAEVEAERSLKLRLSALSAQPPAPTPQLLARLQGLAVPGVEPAARPTRSVVPAVHVGAPAAPPARGPAAGRPPARPAARRRARRGTRRSGVGAGLLLLGVGLALALGSPTTGAASTPVDPGSDAFVVDFISTTTEVPLADPAGRAALLPRP
jgi:anti-sigma factor RsiW